MKGSTNETAPVSEPGTTIARTPDMTPLCFATSYPVNGDTYASHLYARTWGEAKQLAQLRGIGERVEGVCEPQSDTPRDLASQAHLACFLGFIALKAGTMTPEEVLGDMGVVHEAIHALCGDPSADMAAVEAGLARLRSRVPGYDPV
jgi:hypothetical protein